MGYSTMPKMKDSGIEWIGQIPEDWELSKIGAIYEERNEKVNDSDFPPLSVTKQGVVPQLETAAKTNDGENRKKICRNDFVINSRSDRRGSCGISDYDGSCSLINTVLKPRRDICNAYYSFVFRSETFADEFYRWGNGIVDDLWSTKWSNMKRIYIPAPPLKEQECIASYLDCKCAQIDAIIAKQQQVIDKLKEYKLSIITEAVTKGLDPDVPMKDSGAEWIGMVPEGWRISRIKYICEFNPKTKKANRDVVSYAPMECVKDGYLIKKEICHDGISTGLTSFEEGDIIMAKVTPCFENGNIAIAKDLVNKFGVGSSELFVFRAKKVNTQWLFYFLRNSIFKKLAEATMTGTGGLKRVSPSFIRDFSLALPPENEQRRIIEYLDKKCMEIDRVIKYKQSAVEKLGQYKKSLIYEVVTGKMEV